MNKKGGIDPQNEESLKKAEAADLITLPEDVQGTNCFNCKFNEIIDPKKKVGYCMNKKVLQPVSSRMCCSLWDAEGSIRPWEKK